MAFKQTTEPQTRIVQILPTGIIYVTFPPYVDEPAARQFAQELKDILQSSKSLVRTLTDTTAVKGLPNPEAKDIIIEGIRNNKSKIAKSAVLVANSFIMVATRLILTLARRSDIKIFQSKEKAMEWLME